MVNEEWTSKKFDNWNIISLVRRQAERYADKVFIKFEDGQQLTFSELNRKSDEFANSLSEFGITSGDRVFCLMKNSSEFLISMFGIMKANAVFVPINTDLKGVFLQHQFNNCSPRLVIVDESLVSAFNGLEVLENPLSGVIVVGKEKLQNIPQALQAEKIFPFFDFIQPSFDCLVNTFLPSVHAICAIMYTSGTSGPSKGVLMPHGHFFSYAFGQVDGLKQTHDDIYYICMPLFHVNALNMQLLGSLLAGSSIFCVERFSASSWLRHCIESQATLTNTLGVMTEYVHNLPESSLDRTHSLRLVCAVPISKEWAENFQRRFGTKLYQAFGMTESGIVYWGDLGDDELVPGCAGYLRSDLYQTVIANPENDEVLEAGCVGELLIRPRHAGIFSTGYFEMPEKTLEAWRSLWFHTGDACFFDAKGRMHYFDRIKDCIRRRGENISAYEVEQALNSFDGIIESAAIGVKTIDSGGEEEILVFIVVSEEATFVYERLIEFCSEIMPRFAVPRFVKIVKMMPKTSSGKLSKSEFREKGLLVNPWDSRNVTNP